MTLVLLEESVEGRLRVCVSISLSHGEVLWGPQVNHSLSGPQFLYL